MINKADAADPLVLARLQRAEPHSIVVSARTGQGIDALRELVEGELPRPGRRVHGAAALRARRPDQQAPPARRDRLDGAHRRGHRRRRPRQRRPGRRARVVRGLTSGVTGQTGLSRRTAGSVCAAWHSSRGVACCAHLAVSTATVLTPPTRPRGSGAIRAKRPRSWRTGTCADATRGGQTRPTHPSSRANASADGLATAGGRRSPTTRTFSTGNMVAPQQVVDEASASVCRLRHQRRRRGALGVDSTTSDRSRSTRRREPPRPSARVSGPKSVDWRPRCRDRSRHALTCVASPELVARDRIRAGRLTPCDYGENHPNVPWGECAALRTLAACSLGGSPYVVAPSWLR